MTAIVIDHITNRQDEEGRFCLNDLHKAAGAERRYEPNLWLTNQTTRELIQELTSPNTGIPVIESLHGRRGGTYVYKELVYAYAMWISPQFHLKVIRAYDRLTTKGVAVHESGAEDLLKNPLKYIREVLDQAEKIKAEGDGLEETVVSLVTDVSSVESSRVHHKASSLCQFHVHIKDQLRIHVSAIFS